MLNNALTKPNSLSANPPRHRTGLSIHHNIIEREKFLT